MLLSPEMSRAARARRRYVEAADPDWIGKTDCSENRPTYVMQGKGDTFYH